MSYRGPSIWPGEPAVRLLVDVGDLERRPTNTIPDFAERLLETVPPLEEHRCTRGRRGGFVECMREGTVISHVLEHVALEVQRLAGANVHRSKTRPAGRCGVYHVVFAYRQEDVALAAHTFDRLIIREHDDPRGRGRGEARSRRSCSPRCGRPGYRRTG